MCSVNVPRYLLLPTCLTHRALRKRNNFLLIYVPSLLSFSLSPSERASGPQITTLIPRFRRCLPLIFCRKDSQSQLQNCNRNIRRSLLGVPKHFSDSHPLRWMAAITALGTPSPPPALTLHQEIGLCHSHPLPFFIR